MKELKLIWQDNGKHNATSSVVSVREFTDYSVYDVLSPTDIVGTGSCYGDALADFADQLNEYIGRLQKFRDEVVLTTKAYTEVVEVACDRKPIDK